MGLMAVGDGIYLFQSAKGTYVEGTLLDALWPAAALLVGARGLAADRQARSPAHRGLARGRDPVRGRLVAVALLAYDHFHTIHDGALLLATITVVLVTVRMALTFSENQRMLRQSRQGGQHRRPHHPPQPAHG